MEATDVRQLPRGRHGLSRAEVRASQRGRMLEAMALAVAAKGYASTTVADVLARARVSRETFYQHFGDKEDCFLAAYELAARKLIEAMTSAADGAPTAPLARFERVLAAYLELMAAEGGLARVFLVDVYAAGPTALGRRYEVFQRFVDVVAEIFGATDPAERFAAESLVGAVSSLVTVRVAAGRLDELRDLRPGLVELARRLRQGRTA